MLPHLLNEADEPTAIRIARPVIPDNQKILQVPIDLILRAADAYMTPRIRAEVAAEFAPYIGRLQIPVLAALRLIDLLVVRCFAGYSREAAHQIIGTNTLVLYQDTPLLRTMFVALRLVPIEYILRFLSRQFTTAYNFGSYEMV